MARRALALLFLLLAFALAMCASPRAAEAVERQHHLGLDPSLSILKVEGAPVNTGGGIGAHYTYGISDQLNFMAGVNGSLLPTSTVVPDPATPNAIIPATQPGRILSALAGVGYVIDVLRFVPYIGVLAGGYHLSGGDLRSGIFVFGGAAQVGIDYQLSRQWAIGVAGQQHFLLTKMSTYPSYTNVLLRFEYMWGF